VIDLQLPIQCGNESATGQIVSEIKLDGTSTTISDFSQGQTSTAIVLNINTSGQYSTTEGEHYIMISDYNNYSGGMATWFYSSPPSGLILTGTL